MTKPLRLTLAVPLAVLLSPALAASRPVPIETYSDLHWRLLGPFRAGWSTCVAGIPGRPETFYFGAADGGVWRTTDAGSTWRSLFDHEAAAAVGSLAVAPSNPAVIYVGTGEPAPRYDATSGNGVYRSTDAGATWRHLGLDETHHVGALLVDPRDPNVVLAAGLGHLYGPNPERGVFRTQDGGAHWDKVLFVDADTGAIDLAADPSRPEIVFAALWQVRRFPWLDYFIPTSGGAGSGIARSTDGGRTWTRLSASGMPAGVGRIGLAVAPGSGGQRVYAAVDGPKIGGLYRSDDGGVAWQRINDDASLSNRYFARVTAHPTDPDTVYVMGRSLRRSTDGGKTFVVVRGAPGGDDYHFLWIDPRAPERMVVGSDQGTVITLNGGTSWSSWYNQPTGQFYHVATDQRFPYRVYSGQQDSGTVGIASRSDYGQLTFRDWHPVGGDERDYDLPDPEDPEIVYGSGLGGRISRFDGRTGRVENVAPWPTPGYARRPTSVRYRYGWVTPIALSARAPHALYLGAQLLFRSLDGGRHWSEISPDLTGSDPQARNCDGDVPLARAKACGFGVVSTIAPSAVDAAVVWAGSDSGLVHVSRDGGTTWRNVTPHGVRDWSKIAQIEASPSDAATAYVAVDAHRIDDPGAHAYRTHDGGATWTEISTGLPATAYVNVVRQDPVEPRLLYAGTRTGAFVSFDDGEHWQALQLELPTTGVNDLTLHGSDLIAATQGRALWSLDDVSPLRQLARGVPASAALFPPAPAYRVRGNENRDTPLPLEEPTAPEPPAAAFIDFVLTGPAASLSLEILDGRGTLLRRWSSGEPAPQPAGERYFSDAWLQAPQPLPKQQGHHRVGWDLRGPRPRALEYDYSIAAVQGRDTPLLPRGSMVSPGTYEIRLTVDGRAQTQQLKVVMDPRLHATAADLDAQAALTREVTGALARLVTAHEAITEESRRRASELARFLSGGGEDDLTEIAGVLTALATDLEAADGPPTEGQQRVASDYAKRLDQALARWEKAKKGS